MNFDNVLGPANVNLIRGGSGAAQQVPRRSSVCLEC